MVKLTKMQKKCFKKHLAGAAILMTLAGPVIPTVTTFASERPKISQVDQTINTNQEFDKDAENINQVDQSIYGNILKNPDLYINSDAINTSDFVTNWQWIDGNKISPSFKIWNNDSYGYQPISENGVLYKETNEFGTKISGLAFYTRNEINRKSGITQRIHLIGGRKYKASVNYRFNNGGQNDGEGYIFLGKKYISSTSRSDNAPFIRSLETKEKQDVETNFQILGAGTRSGIGGGYFYNLSNISVQMTYGEQWKQIDNLFTTLDHTQLVNGVTEQQIQEVKNVVASIPNNTDATEMTAALKKADELYKVQALQETENLFTDSTYHTLKPEVTSQMIDELKTKVDQMTDKEKQGEAKGLLDIATALLDQAAQTAVDGLYKTANHKEIKTGLMDTDVANAQAVVIKLGAGTKKSELQGLLDQATAQIKQRGEKEASAEAQVLALFTDDTDTALKETTTKEMVTDAQKTVSSLEEGANKTKLQQLLDTAKKLLEERIAPTTVSPLNTATGIVFGTGEPNANYEIKNESGTVLASGRIHSDGNYYTEIAPQKEGTIITVTVTNSDGQQSSVIEKVLRDTLMPTTISEITSKTTQVTGTGEPGGTIVLVNQDGKELVRGTISDEGTYSVTIPAQKDGDTLSAVTLKGDPVKVSVVTVTVGDKDIVSEEIDALFTNDTHKTLKDTVNGETLDGLQKQIDKMTNATKKAEAQKLLNVAKELLSKDAKRAVDNLFSDDQYTTLKSGVTEKDLAHAQEAVNKLSDGAEKTSLQKLLETAKKLCENQQKAPAITKVNEFTVGKDAHVTGVFEGGAVKKIGISINGQDRVIAGLTNDMLKNGTFSYYTGYGQIQGTDKVQVVLYDASNKELARKDVIVKGNPVETNTIKTVNEFTIGTDRNVTGTFEGDSVQKIGLTVNGQQKAIANLTAAMKKNGTFSYYTGPSGIKAGDKVQVTLYDKENKALGQKDMVVKANESETNGIKTVTDFTVGKDKFVKGTFEVNKAKRLGLTVDGEQKAIVNLTVDMVKEGTFSYYVGPTMIKTGSKVQVILYDAQNNQVAQQNVLVK